MGGTDLEIRRVVNGKADLLSSFRLQPSDEVELTSESRETDVSPAASAGEPGLEVVHVVTITSRDEDVVTEAEVWPGTIQKARGEEGERIAEVASEAAQEKSDANAEAVEAAEAAEPAEVPEDDSVEGPSVTDHERHPTKGEVKDEAAAEAALADDEEDVGTGPYEGRTNEQLKALLRKQGKPVSGTHDELVDRARE